MKVTLKKSFDEAIKSGKAWLFGSLSGTIGVLLLYYSNFEKSIGESLLYGGIIIVLIFIFIFVYRFLTNFKNAWRKLNIKNTYGEAIIKLMAGFADIHELRKIIDQRDANSIIILQTLSNLFQEVKEFFDYKTNSKCSISMKVLASPDHLTEIDDEAELVTFCRDRKTANDRDLNKKDITHTIRKNTAFLEIFNYLGHEKGRYYLNNNLPNDLTYENTSIDVYGEKIDGNITDEKKRTQLWPLPYKSEIVVPIRPIKKAQDREYKLLGFLTVDSSRKDVFNEKYDIPLMRGVADGIVDIVETLYRIQHEQQSQNY